MISAASQVRLLATRQLATNAGFPHMRHVSRKSGARKQHIWHLINAVGNYAGRSAPAGPAGSVL